MKRQAIAALGVAALVFGGAALAQNGPTTLVEGHGAPPPASAPRLAAVLVDSFPGTGTNAGPTLTHLRSPPCTTVPCDSRVFLLSKQGIIYILKDGQRLAEPFIDYSADVNASRNTINGEQGSHSFAFHPNFAQNGKFYVFFLRPAPPSGMDAATAPPVANDLARIVREYTVSADNPDRADLASGRDILIIPRTGGNIHNGGAMVFGPDGYLYIGIGDGGQGGVNARGPGAQDPNSLYGKLLRIDVNTTSEGRQYGIPAGNLYAAGEGLPEIVALGLRNPFGFHIDGDWLFWGETGENSWEEVGAYNLRNGVGSNFGWSITEGVGCLGPNDAVRTPANQTCDKTGLTPPVFEYHSQLRPNPCSAIGGITYRGSAIPELQGQYFFGDYCVGLIRSFELVNGVARNVTNWTDMIAPGYRFGLGAITGFGEDSQGEMYILTTTYVFGTAANLPNPAIARVWKIVPAEGAPAPAPRDEWVATTQNPNPPVLQPPPLQREAPPANLGLPLFSTFTITQTQIRADANVPDRVAGVLPAGTNVVLAVTINGRTRSYTLPVPASSDFSSDRLNALLQTFAEQLNGDDFWGVPVTASYAATAAGAEGNGTLTIGSATPATFDRFTILVTAGPESGTTSGNFFSSLTATP